MKATSLIALIGFVALSIVLPACEKKLSEHPAAPSVNKSNSADVSVAERTIVDRAMVDRAIEAGRFDEAARLLKPMLMVDSKNVELLFLMAQVEAASGHFNEAVDLLDAIPIETPDAGVAALGQSADWCTSMGRLDEAEARFRKLIKILPQNPIAYRRLAQLLNNEGRRFEAAGPMRKMVQLGEFTSGELYGLNCYAEPFVHSLDFLTGVPAVEPNALCQARLLAYEGKLREALAIMEPLLVSQSDATAVTAYYGRLQAELQNSQAVEKWMTAVSEAVQREPEYWYAVGLWHQSQNLHDIAIRCFLETVLRDDTNRFAYLALAQSLASKQRTAESQQVKRRYNLLEEANLVVVEVAQTEAQLSRLVEVLLLLQRPYEARAWMTVQPDIQSASPTNRSTPDSIIQSEQKDAIEKAIRAIKSNDRAFAACGLEPEDWPLPKFTGVTASIASSSKRAFTPGMPLELVNVADRVGLKFRYFPNAEGQVDKLLFQETVGGGIAVLDFDLDGWPDLYFSQAGGKVDEASSSLPNRLFRNLSGKAYEDASVFSDTGDLGYGQGVSAADINQDGFMDLAVANIGLNSLFINNGDGTFRRTEIAASFKNANQWTTSIACGDLNGDNLPELVEINYIDDAKAFAAVCIGETKTPQCNPQRYKPAPDRFLRNVGDGMLEVWQNPGPPRSKGYGFAAIISNFDKQAGNDMFVANDTDGNEYWVSNQTTSGADKFSLSEQAALRGCQFGLIGTAQSCMGVAHGDFDHNGLMDLHVTNYTEESSDLYMQQPSGLFLNQFTKYGLDIITKPMIGWGTQAADFDSDGWLDMAILNGHLYYYPENHTNAYRMRPQLVRGGPEQFVENPAASSTDPYWSTPALGRALATVDWNRDGKVDLVANHLDADAALLENQTLAANWLQVELVGTVSERDAVGAEVVIEGNGQTWSNWRVGGDGYLCSSEPVLQFGLGTTSTIDSIEVQWPSGARSRFEGFAPNQRLLLVEGEDRAATRHD